MTRLKDLTRHKSFISYHHDDEEEVEDFIRTYDGGHDVLISRGIGAGMDGGIINSTDADYIKRQIRSLYLRDSSVTIVMVGRCTWSRRFVDWEVSASLRNTATSTSNGLLAVALPSVGGTAILPDRVADNISGVDHDAGYARFWSYLNSAGQLANMIESAFAARQSLRHLVDNIRTLRRSNASC